MTEAKNMMSPATRRSKPAAGDQSLDRSEREANQIKEALVAGDRALNNEESIGAKNHKKEGQVSDLIYYNIITRLNL